MKPKALRSFKMVILANLVYRVKWALFSSPIIMSSECPNLDGLDNKKKPTTLM